MKLRSLLLVSGDSQAGIAKAAMLASDALILDLQSAATEKAKAAARLRAAAWLKSRKRGGLMVRINPQGSDSYFGDLLAIVPARPAAIVVPRCGGLRDLMELDHHLDAIETANALPRGATKVLAVAESLAAVRAACYRGAPSRLIGLCFGAEGLGAEFGVAPRGPDGSYRAPLLQARNDLLVAAAQAGVAAIDAPFPDSLDVEGLGREIHAAANDGFAGKICLHPSQVAAITAAFTASPERAEWARRIKRAFDAAPDRDVLTLDGSLIDRLQLGVAERILSAFE